MYPRTAFPKTFRLLLAVTLALSFVAGLMIAPSAVAGLLTVPPHADPPTFHWVATWGEAAAPGELSHPADIALDAAGNVYVADAGNHRVQVFTADGVLLRTFGHLGRGDGEFYNPRGIAVRGDRVYVADTNNSRVQVFTLGGDFIRQVGQWANRDPDSLPDPVGVDADAAGRIYVLSLTSSYAGSQRAQRLSRFAPDGAPEGFRENGCATGALAVDSTGIAYCSWDTWGVTRISPSWEFQQIATNSGQPGFLHRPRALAIAPDDSLWVYELDDSQVKHYDSQGTFLSSFALPSGVIALVATGDRLLVLTDAPQVVTYDWLGNRLAAWGTTAFAAPGSFDHPDHLAAAPDGTLYVLEQRRGRIQHLDGNGQLLAVISAGQASQGSLNKPEALTVDVLGRLYVLDPNTQGYDDSRIVRFVADHFETAFDAGFAYYPYPTNSMGLFSNLAAAGDTLLVMSAVGQVERTDLDGVRINEWSFGWPKYQFTGLAVGASGRVYGVNSLDPPSVKAATLVGADQFTWGGTWVYDTLPLPGTCVMPSAVAADLRGRVFVLDTDNRSMPHFAPIFSSRVQIFDEDGQYLASWGSFGRADGQFANAQAIAALPDGRIVVADTGNNRLQVFAPNGPLPPYTPLPGPTRYDTPLPPLAATWEDHGPAGGSAPDGLAIPPVVGPESPIIAWTRSGQAANSTDGSHWTRRTSWLPPFLLYAGSRTLIGTDGINVWRSDDGGLTWTWLANAPGTGWRRIMASPAYDTNGVLFDASFGAGFWRSTDRGDTWELRSLAGAELEYPAVAMNADGTHTILVSEYTGPPPRKLWRSTDDGLTWQATGLKESLVAFSPGFAADRTVFALQQYTEEDGIQRSTDGGVSWERIGAGSLPAGQYQDWDGLAISPNFSADHTLVAWTYRSAPHGVYLSTDAGQTWVGIAPRVYEQRFAAFSPNYAQDHRLWRSEAGSSAHFLVTTDNGQSWQAAGDMPGATVYGLTSAGPGNDSPLWALTPYGLLATSPTGDVPTWLLDYTSLYASQRPGARSALAVSPSFAQDGTAVAHDSITTDGGQSWQALSFAEELRNVRTSAAAFAPDFARSHVIAIGWSSSDGNQGGPFALSADGGQTWQRWWHPVAAPVAVVFDAAWPTNPAVYLAGERGLVHSSLQDWQRAGWSVDWQRAGEPVGWLNVTGLVSRIEGTESVLYAATSTHGVWRSADGGVTWAAFNAGLPGGRTCRLANAADLLAVSLCDRSLYLWQSALASWQRLGDPAPGGVNALVLQRGCTEGIVWAGTASGLYRTTFSAPVLTPRLWFPLLLRQ